MSPRTGRPKVDNPKSERFTVRIDKDTRTILEENCAYYNETVSESIVRGIREVNKGLKK